MSHVYSAEPPCEGKVLLHTSKGDIDIELWPKQAPKACRNFVQLILEGYYDNTIFHRVIKDFMIQGGDPTGTGRGGASIYGEDFADEIHPRLRFNHRGILAMASEGPNTNASQFFITFDKAEWLNKKHTIFGKVTGNTIFNLLEMRNVEVGPEDRPINPPKLLRAEVLNNPFDDIVPRAVPKKDEGEDKKKKRKRKGKKDLKLLSFGDEAAEEEEEVNKVSQKTKIVSSHQALTDDPLLRAAAVPTASSKGERKPTKEQESGGEEDGHARKKHKHKHKHKHHHHHHRRDDDHQAADADSGDGHKDAKQVDAKDFDELMKERVRQRKDNTARGGDGRELTAKEQRALERQKEMAALAGDIKTLEERKANDVARQAVNAAATAPKISALEERRMKYLKNKGAKNKKDRAAEALARMNAMKKLIHSARADDSGAAGASAGGESTHGAPAVPKGHAGDDDDDTNGWLANRLDFQRSGRAQIDPSLHLASVDDYEVIDPLAQSDGSLGKDRRSNAERARDHKAKQSQRW